MKMTWFTFKSSFQISGKEVPSHSDKTTSLGEKNEKSGDQTFTSSFIGSKSLSGGLYFTGRICFPMC